MSRALWWNRYCELAIAVRSILFGKKVERSSEDLKAGTFNLRKSATGSNGDAFGSEDVIENFKHWLGPTISSSNRGHLSSIPDTPRPQFTAATRINLRRIKATLRSQRQFRRRPALFF